MLATPLRAGDEAQHLLGGGEVAGGPGERREGLDKTVRLYVGYLCHLDSDRREGMTYERMFIVRGGENRNRHA